MFPTVRCTSGRSTSSSTSRRSSKIATRVSRRLDAVIKISLFTSRNLCQGNRTRHRGFARGQGCHPLMDSDEWHVLCVETKRPLENFCWFDRSARSSGHAQQYLIVSDHRELVHEWTNVDLLRSPLPFALDLDG